MRVATPRSPENAVREALLVWGISFATIILAFIFIGLQLRPILGALEPSDRGPYFLVAGAVLLTVIAVRMAWQMSYNAVIRWRHS